MSFGTVYADKLTVENVVIPKGGQGTIVVNYQFDAAEQYSGWQFSLQLPNDVITVKNNKGTSLFTAGDCHDASYTITSSYSGGVDNYVALSLESSPITGTEGVLLSIPFTTTAEYEVGTIFQASIVDIQFGNKDGVHTTIFDNVNFSITVEENDGRIHFNELDTSLPDYTAGEKGNVLLARTIKANEWSTIVLPFTLTKAKAEAAFGNDVQLAEFTGWEAEYADGDEDITPDNINIHFSTYTMSAKKPMTGGKPFLIKVSHDITEIEADDVTLFRTITDVNKVDEYDTPGKMTGSLVKTIIPEDGLFISNQTFYYSTGSTNVKAFRCWFDLGAVLDKETNFESKVHFFVDEVSTSVEDIPFNIQTGTIYDLNGLLIGKDIPLNSLKKGVYIMNGKKYVVR